MRTILFLPAGAVAMLLLFVTFIPTSAQMAAGLRAGVRLSGLAVGKPGAGSLDQPGAFVTVPLEWRVTGLLALQSEVSYVQKGARWTDTYIDYHGGVPIKVREETRIGMHYLEAALLAKIFGKQQKISYFAGAGPYLGYQLADRAASPATSGASGWDGEQSSLENQSEVGSPHLQTFRLDTGLNFCAGWVIHTGPDWRLILEFQYQLGLRPVADLFPAGDRTANRGFSFQAGFLKSLDWTRKSTDERQVFSHPMMR